MSPLRRGTLAALLVSALLTACGTAPQSQSLAGIGVGLQGPRGMQATRYATGLASVSALAFDGEGRLWAATADFNDEGRDSVYLVLQPGAAPTRVITDLHTPMGLLWYQQSLYVSSHGAIDLYSGFDGTKFADHQRIITLPSGMGTPGGLAIGPDGRLVVGESAPCDSCTPDSDFAGAVLSFDPDGSDLRIFARHIRAPVGLAYRPGTNDLFATMNQRDDLGAKTPGDWLSLVREGDDWHYPDCYGQPGDACAGAPRAVAELDPHAAVSGIAFLPEKDHAAVVAEWAKGTVLKVALSPSASSYTGTVSPFLRGLKNPVPVLADAAALFVGDWATGIVYRIAAAD